MPALDMIQYIIIAIVFVAAIATIIYVIINDKKNGDL
ncbi:MAG: FeoB-associated Cys-rich membrane protein [Campylobacter sp.]|nr:FeoB-associated Cys-rich membrane protein [Campylobacter sp.]